MTSSRAARLWHTLRWLRPVQFWGRFRNSVYRPGPNHSAAPAPRSLAGTWQSCDRMGSMTGPAAFRFLNTEYELQSPADWNNSAWPRLWLYNLHYFDDLNATGASERSAWHSALIENWLRDNPAAGGVGWEPYPTSLRMVNWIKWITAGNQPVPGMVDSLATQTRWLRKKLEYHLLGNHLWANAKALVFAGTFFQGAEADHWRNHGLRLLRQELAEQILPDGGHFERSPMYHATLLEDILDLVQLGSHYPGVLDESDSASWRDSAGQMLRWLQVMSHPDGEIAFFNDAIPATPNLAALEQYAQQLGITTHSLPLNQIELLSDSGYVRLAAGPAVLIADVGPIGPDYLPGHAHADTLSFELSLHGRRLLVNSGISTYEVGPERLRQRGTAAHNTVVVDGQDSSEVWSSFRVARRARPIEVESSLEPDGSLRLQGGHDGYLRLPGRVIHRREWRLTPTGLTITDRLSGTPQTAQVRFHLHPDASPRDLGTITPQLDQEPGTWHPGFGQSMPNQVLVGDFGNGNEFITRFTWGEP